ncbi:vitamin-D-receptor interacting mediator subunit 4-domain-containing protein [Pseudomassariella vexata]|uniref:Mediator of RNA polymerase II transcription subunit 4 n=1 Tax=Pseudomassariella vexata TaxID=1141098 RepID=A0A1Y2DFT8_9PEZI|nr:vitamin-D-receptor interacting mediator subunit 4-domain-containing protein [Pseudomassariella vexata]ORY58128.1 vitamin-D-receptor interacting mediator subunit 4-domain-containing protein [Pseudomassariella vexata]
MDIQVDLRFDRVDKALTNLIDSIVKYNTSAHQGNELVIADNELSKGLEDVQKHQQNYARLENLRSITKSLDTQIKETLTLLAQTRKELSSTTATVYPSGSHYPIDYSELLTVARRISSTTLPRQSVLDKYRAEQAQQALAAEQADKVQQSGGAETTATTPASTPQANGVAVVNGPASQPSQADPSSQQITTSAGTNLPEHLIAHLNPRASEEFIPWPSEQHVRRGALAELAHLAAQGIAAEGYDPAEEAARKLREEEEAKAKEEKERLEREEAERKMREQRERARKEAAERAEKEAANWRRGSVVGGPASAGLSAGGAAAAGEKKQFQFMDDDDESD